ncbi:MAG: hypothetical protein AAFU34_15565 [Pseudomonadota bacterium]
MAIEHVKSTIYPDQSAGYAKAIYSTARNGNVTIYYGTVANAADANTGSTYTLCTLPASCSILPETLIRLTDWGFAQVQVGVKGAATSLINEARSDVNRAPVAVFDGKFGKPLWQQAGLASPPRGDLDIIVTAAANATAAGALPFAIQIANHL